MKWLPSFRRDTAVAPGPPPPPSRAAPGSSSAILTNGPRSIPDDDLVGKTLNGTYVVDGVIGEGGMGRVYRARHTRIASKEFAVKVLRPEFTRNPDVVTRFRREAEAAASITHANVVGVYDVDSTPEGHSYLVCEYLKGRDLADELAQGGPLDIASAAHIAVEVARGLEAAHARGVVHRDLKPHNVFLLEGESGVVPARPLIKVLDFGLSRFVDAPGTQLTQTGVIMGTPAYMAPEQADGSGADLRTDVYGLGAVLFTALCGRPPFEGETLQAVVLAVMSQEAPRVRTLNPDLPENLELVIQRAMARRREDRYQTMVELRRALEPFAAAHTSESGVASAPRSAQSSRSLLEADARAVSTARPRLLAYSGLALVLLIAGVSSTLPAVELVTGKLRFTRAEVALFFLGIAGTLLTPTLIWMGRLRHRVWTNHPRVLALLDSVRGVLFAAVLSYGLATLGVRFLDDVVARIVAVRFIGHDVVRGWPGWNLLYMVVALVMGGVTGARIGIERAASSGFARRVTPLLSLAGAFVCVFVLYAGFVWRSHGVLARVEAERVAAPLTTAPAADAPAPNAAPKPPTAPPVAAPPAPAVPTPPVAAAPAEPILRAPVVELAQASAKGVDGLLPLAEKYPRDPAVLKPLVIAFASRSTGLADAMVIATRLFDVAPEQAADSDLRFLLKRAATTPGESQKLALEAMRSHMGSAGPDLLYELMLTEPKASRIAQDLLTTPPVRERTSPALAVAYDLRLLPTCAAKVPLLERAAGLGDERSVAILAPLATGARKGCGRRRRDPCPPPCSEEAKRFQETIARINARTGSTRR
jgi:serine/threonine protein kinase